VLRAVDDLDARYLTGVCKFRDFDPPGRERFIEGDVVQPVAVGPGEVKDFD
jgi:hypothetical protein